MRWDYVENVQLLLMSLKRLFNCLRIFLDRVLTFIPISVTLLWTDWWSFGLRISGYEVMKRWWQHACMSSHLSTRRMEDWAVMSPSAFWCPPPPKKKIERCHWSKKEKRRLYMSHIAPWHFMPLHDCVVYFRVITQPQSFEIIPSPNICNIMRHGCPQSSVMFLFIGGGGGGGGGGGNLRVLFFICLQNNHL